jgi:hypothetical protein
MRRTRTSKLIDAAPEEVGAILEYRELYNQLPTPQSVITLFSRTSKATLITFACTMSALMHANAAESLTSSWQIAHVRDFEGALNLKKALRLMGEGRILFHEAQLGLIVRYALVFGNPDASIGDEADNLLRLATALNELYAGSAFPEKGTHAEKRHAFLKLELQATLIPNQRLAGVVHRFHRFFAWADNLSVDSENWLPLSKDVSRFFDMTPAEYLTAGFAVMAPFLNTNKLAAIKINKPRLELAMYDSIADERKTAGRWTRRFATHEDELSRNFEPTFSQRDLLPFIEHPLILLRDGGVLCPMLSLLEDTLNTQLHFSMYGAYESREGTKAARRLSRLQGQFLEAYVHELISRSASKVYTTVGEIKYKATDKSEKKSTDVVAIRQNDGNAVFVEVTKRRFRLNESIIAMNESAVLTDIDEMVLKKAKQIHDRIRDLRDGQFSYPLGIQEIAPVVVTGQSIPGLAFLRDYIEEELLDRGHLQETVPLTHCDVEDLEWLSVVAPGQLDLFQLFANKARHPNPLVRRQSLNNYIQWFRKDLTGGKTWREMTPPNFELAMNEMIPPVLASWSIGTGQPFVGDGVA